MMLRRALCEGEAVMVGVWLDAWAEVLDAAAVDVAWAEPLLGCALEVALEVAEELATWEEEPVCLELELEPVVFELLSVVDLVVVVVVVVEVILSKPKHCSDSVVAMDLMGLSVRQVTSLSGIGHTYRDVPGADRVRFVACARDVGNEVDTRGRSNLDRVVVLGAVLGAGGFVGWDSVSTSTLSVGQGYSQASRARSAPT